MLTKTTDRGRTEQRLAGLFGQIPFQSMFRGARHHLATNPVGSCSGVPPPSKCAWERRYPHVRLGHRDVVSSVPHVQERPQRSSHPTGLSQQEKNRVQHTDDQLRLSSPRLPGSSQASTSPAPFKTAPHGSYRRTRIGGGTTGRHPSHRSKLRYGAAPPPPTRHWTRPQDTRQTPPSRPIDQVNAVARPLASTGKKLPTNPGGGPSPNRLPPLGSTNKRIPVPLGRRAGEPRVNRPHPHRIVIFDRPPPTTTGPNTRSPASLGREPG